MLTQNLGCPRIGVQREVKKACEQFWTGKISEKQLLKVARNEREKNWYLQKISGIDIIPCNDFTLYDQVQDMTFMLGALPERYKQLKGVVSDIDLYFAMCSGYQKDGYDTIAMEMTKWFNTNYHYIVPEFVKNQQFNLNSGKIIVEFQEAKMSGVNNPKPVVIGPVSYLLLGKEKEAGFNRLELIDNVLPEYLKVLNELEEAGCEYIQFDEPFLVTELPLETQQLFKKVYDRIVKESSLKIILATYFDSLDGNIEVAISLPVDVLHLDLVDGKEQLKNVVESIPQQLKLSLGIVDGRNIWKNNYKESLEVINYVVDVIGEQRVMVAPSCSLLHVPYDLDLETNEKTLPAAVKNWMAFAKQKLKEVVILATLAKTSDTLPDNLLSLLKINSLVHQERENSSMVHDGEVKVKVEDVINREVERVSPFKERIVKQNKVFDLPLFPTTTIGSLPQTKEVRRRRKEWKRGIISLQKYESFIKDEIKKSVKWQDEIGVDVLVHGEFERNDMVEYFGEELNGFAFTENGWVQSYGSRGVKPPVVFGDVSRKKPMTVDWWQFSQSLTEKRMKGMLTGPVTVLQWSFVRNDISREQIATQIALSLRDEVLDLEKAGAGIIQIDEPALREGLPLKKRAWDNYLKWAVKAFRICSLGVKDETQIHTHMCYAEFNDIFNAIADMDADVITIETSRSQMEILDTFGKFNYPNQVGPGVYDIHSPRIPSVKEMVDLIEKAMQYIPSENLWVNPDCGLKTREWEDVESAISNMVKAAHILREKR